MPIKTHLDSIRASFAEERSPASNKRGAPNPKLRLLFATLALFAAGFAAARQVASWPDRLRYPGELDIVEGRELADMVMLREGVPVYAPATPERFNAVGYGPLFYLLGSRLVDPQRPSYEPMRVVAMLGTLGLAVSCGLLAWWLSRSYLAAALGALLFLAFAFTTGFGVSIHCDTIALLLWSGGFLIAYRFRESKRILLAVPLMALGFFYKGQFVAGLLAVVCYLLFGRRFRLAALFGGFLVGAVVSLFLLFQFVVFRHQAFWLHALVYNAIPFSIIQGLAWALVAGAILGVPALVAVQYLRTYPDRLLAYWYAWAVFLTLLTVAKQGSSINYSFELLLLICALFASLLAREIATPARGLLMLCLLGVTLWTGQILQRDNRPHLVDFAQDHAVQVYLRTNFPAHSPALGVFTGDLLRAGLDTPIANIYQYSWLVCRGTLPAQGLVAQIQERRFRVILLNQDFRSKTDPYLVDYLCVTEPLRQAILQNYKLDAQFDFDLPDKRHYYAWVQR